MFIFCFTPVVKRSSDGTVILNYNPEQSSTSRDKQSYSLKPHSQPRKSMVYS